MELWIAVAVVIVLGLVGVCWLWARGGRPTRRLSGSQSVARRSELVVRIDRLLMGDRAARERLLAAARRNHPGKSARWYEEKVLADLERDRR